MPNETTFTSAMEIDVLRSQRRALRQALTWCVVNSGETLGDHPNLLRRFREILGMTEQPPEWFGSHAWARAAVRGIMELEAMSMEEIRELVRAYLAERNMLPPAD